MGKRYRKRRKRIVFRKIKLSRNAKMWIILGSVLLLLVVVSWISDNEFLSGITFGLTFTMPLVLGRYQLSKTDWFKHDKSHTPFIYAYIAVIWLFVLFYSIKIRLLLAFIYLIVCGIHLLRKTGTLSLEEFDIDFCFLCLIEGIMIIMMLGFPFTTEMNAWGWIFTVVLTSVLFFSIVLSTKGLLLKKADISVLKKIGYYTIISCLIFFLSWQTTIGLNYALDFSEPTVYSTRIAEKEYQSASKGSSASYSFTTYIDGKQKEIEVTSDIYKKYEKGENVELHIHRGVLGMTYYTVN